MMIVVTGGAGFIGSNLVAELERRQAYEVAVCDRLSGADKWRNLRCHAITEFVEPPELFDFIGSHKDRIEVIVHLGAISSTTETDARRVIADNFVFSSRLWDWCVTAGRRLIYASSAATYGDGSEGFDDDASIEYLRRLRPLNLYAWSKHLFDCRVSQQVAVQMTPPQWAGLKFFNVYGPNEYHKSSQQSMAAHAFRSLQRDGRVRLFRSTVANVADGDQQRDFIAVEDCVEVILWLIDNGAVSGLFNVGTGVSRTFNALARAVIEAIGGHGEIEYFDMPPPLARSYQNLTEANMGRLRSVGFDRNPRSLEDGVSGYVRDFLLQEDPYR
jgi:ADP-L-glycero-D-manno-heptose 6-epimerase